MLGGVCLELGELQVLGLSLRSSLCKRCSGMMVGVCLEVGELKVLGLWFRSTPARTGKLHEPQWSALNISI